MPATTSTTNQQRSSLRDDGSRAFVYPADVRGRFTRLRNVAYTGLISIYLVLPFIDIGGRPAVFLDIQQRKFYLFSFTFNAQDVWLMFFLLSGMAFGLVFLTALLGRVWCGYACPQTVFMEGVYRRIERWVEGPAAKRKRRNNGPWTLDKLWRKLVVHSAYITISAALAHVFLSYFVSMPSLVEWVGSSPSAHPFAFGWVAAMTAITYGNFAWFREQVCVVVCPYGRLQSVLTDANTIIIGYDERRGEPRGKLADADAGDCVDCSRCVAVCPTGIDIRNGLQADCIGCAACIDACDDIMGRLGRDPGLVRYDSLQGLQGEPRRIWRLSIGIYALLGVIGLVVALVAFGSHQSYEANLLRLQGNPYVVEGSVVRNSFELHLVNKSSSPVRFVLEPETSTGIEYVIQTTDIQLEAMASTTIPIFGILPRDQMRRGLKAQVSIQRPDLPEAEPGTVGARFLGPR